MFKKVTEMVFVKLSNGSYVWENYKMVPAELSNGPYVWENYRKWSLQNYLMVSMFEKIKEMVFL